MTAYVAPRVTPHEADETRLLGRVAVVARIASLLLVLLGLFFFSAGIPQLVAVFETPCSADTCPVTPQQAQAVIQLGVSLRTLGLFVAAYYIVYVGVAVVLAGIILWRRGDDWMALLVAIMLVF